MSDYVKATDFASKDALLSGNPAKVIKGTEIDTEFNAIAVAVSTKADLASPTFTGTPSAPTASAATNTTQIATTAFVQSALSTSATSERTATATLTNKTISADNNTISGIAASSFVVSDASGNIDGSAAQKTIPSGSVVGTTDTQTLTNKTVALGSNTVSGTKAQFNSAVTDTDFAFNNDFTGSNQSLNNNGYQKLPGGLIIQWGRNSPGSVTFPLAFTTACFSVAASAGSNFEEFVDVTTISTTGFTLGTNGNSASSPWIAVGY